MIRGHGGLTPTENLRNAVGLMVELRSGEIDASGKPVRGMTGVLVSVDDWGLLFDVDGDVGESAIPWSRVGAVVLPPAARKRA